MLSTKHRSHAQHHTLPGRVRGMQNGVVWCKAYPPPPKNVSFCFSLSISIYDVPAHSRHSHSDTDTDWPLPLRDIWYGDVKHTLHLPKTFIIYFCLYSLSTLSIYDVLRRASASTLNHAQTQTQIGPYVQDIASIFYCNKGGSWASWENYTAQYCRQ